MPGESRWKVIDKILFSNYKVRLDILADNKILSIRNRTFNAAKYCDGENLTELPEGIASLSSQFGDWDFSVSASQVIKNSL